MYVAHKFWFPVCVCLYERVALMARFDFLWPRWVNLNNVQADSQLDLISILVNFACELGRK